MSNPLGIVLVVLGGLILARNHLPESMRDTVSSMLAIERTEVDEKYTGDYEEEEEEEEED